MVIFPGEVLAFQNIERQAHALRAPALGTVVEGRHPRALIGAIAAMPSRRGPRAGGSSASGCLAWHEPRTMRDPSGEGGGIHNAEMAVQDRDLLGGRPARASERARSSSAATSM